MTTKRQEEEAYKAVLKVHVVKQNKNAYSKTDADKAAKKLREVQAKYGAKAIADAKRKIKKEDELNDFAASHKRVKSSSKKSAAKKLTLQEMRASMDRRNAAATKRAPSKRSAAQREAEIQALLSQFGKSKVARAAKQVQRELTAKRAVSSSDVVMKGVHVTVVKKGARKPNSDCKKLKVTATKSVLVCPVFDGS